MTLDDLLPKYYETGDAHRWGDFLVYTETVCINCGYPEDGMHAENKCLFLPTYYKRSKNARKLFKRHLKTGGTKRNERIWTTELK
jgi:hypothetical protein